MPTLQHFMRTNLTPVAARSSQQVECARFVLGTLMSQ